MTNVFINIK